MRQYWFSGSTSVTQLLVGGRALIPKNAFGWPTLCGFFTRPPHPAAFAG